eukprot:957268-Amphidinium_carterae.1
MMNLVPQWAFAKHKVGAALRRDLQQLFKATQPPLLCVRVDSHTERTGTSAVRLSKRACSGSSLASEMAPSRIKSVLQGYGTKPEKPQRKAQQ